MPAMLIIFLVVFINLVGFGIVIPLLPFYGEHFGAAPDTVTVLMATYSAAQFLTAPFWGRLSDCHGRRPLLLISLAGTVVAYVWLAYAPNLITLFWARALGGVMAGSIGVSFAYVADITTPENRSRGMGMIGAAFGLGFIAGPAVGGILAGPNLANANFELPSLAAAGFSFVALILAVFILKESQPQSVRDRAAAEPGSKRHSAFFQLLKNRQYLLVLGLSFFAVFVFAGLEATFALWSERTFGWGPRRNGYIFAFVGLISAVIQGGLVGPLSRRFGERTLVLQGFAALAAGMALLPLSQHIVPLLAVLVIVSYGFSVSTPALNGLMSISAGEASQGSALGIGRSATTLSRTLGPPWAGLLFASFGKDSQYFAGAAVMAIIFALGFLLAKTKKY